MAGLKKLSLVRRSSGANSGRMSGSTDKRSSSCCRRCNKCCNRCLRAANAVRRLQMVTTASGTARPKAAIHRASSNNTITAGSRFTDTNRSSSDSANSGLVNDGRDASNLSCHDVCHLRQNSSNVPANRRKSATAPRSCCGRAAVKNSPATRSMTANGVSMRRRSWVAHAMRPATGGHPRGNGGWPACCPYSCFTSSKSEQYAANSEQYSRCVAVWRAGRANSGSCSMALTSSRDVAVDSDAATCRDSNRSTSCVSDVHTVTNAW